MDGHSVSTVLICSAQASALGHHIKGKPAKGGTSPLSLHPLCTDSAHSRAVSVDAASPSQTDFTPNSMDVSWSAVTCWPDKTYSLLLVTGVIWATQKCQKQGCQWSRPNICHSLHGSPELVCTSWLWHRLGESQESSKELTAITCPALFPILSSWNTTTHCYGYAGFDTQLSATLSTAKSAPPDYRRNPAQAAFWQQLLPIQLFPCTSLPPPSTHCRTKSLSAVHTGKKHNYTHAHTILSPS